MKGKRLVLTTFCNDDPYGAIELGDMLESQKGLSKRSAQCQQAGKKLK